MTDAQGRVEVTREEFAAIGLKLIKWAGTLSDREQRTLAGILEPALAAMNEDVHGHIIIVGGRQLTDFASIWRGMLGGGRQAGTGNRRQEIVAKLNELR